MSTDNIKEFLETLIESGYLTEERGDASGGHLLAQAKALLKNLKAPKKPLKVKKWLRTGELSGKNKEIQAVMEECGGLLDHACSSEILGEVAFVGNDGKPYVITTEALVQEANPEYIKNLDEEDY
jgi:hypothetical protein